MAFNSFQYFIFFPIVVLFYFIIRSKYRWIFLLAASYYFYGSSNIKYAFLLLISTFISYITAIGVGNTGNMKKRKFYLILGLIIHLGILFIYKYFNFFNGSMGALLNSLNLPYNIPNFKLLLPVGISFYTFQVLSYIIEVYKGKIKPEKHFGIYALYVSFFPQILSGPINRPDKLLPQFYQKNDFDFDKFVSGLRLFFWGLFKKVVIADRLAAIVNLAYNNPREYNGLSLIIATVFFAFQIYCDFSGYSEMAIGSARILGIELMQNFNRPYHSKSIKDFWNRWHISLSSWLKDYVYISLGGNRVKLPRYYLNLFITFAVSGLWHGANWTFVLWGALHGIYLIVGHVTKNLKNNFSHAIRLDKLPFIHKCIKILITFALVCFAWIFFKANTLSDAYYIITHMLSDLTSITSLGYIKSSFNSIGVGKFEFIEVFMMIAFMEIVEYYGYKENSEESWHKKPLILRWSLYYTVLFLIILLGVFSSASQFIYFQF